MVDLAPIRARLSNPLEVAGLLGLKVSRSSSRKSRSVFVLCPEHRDREPSCSLSVAESGDLRAKCFACGWSGDVFGLVASVRGLNRRTEFATVVREAAELAGIEAKGWAPPRRAKRNSPDDLVPRLAHRILCLADDVLRGRMDAELGKEGLRDPLVESSPFETICQALELLKAADELIERRDGELDARAAAFDREDARRFALACGTC